MILFLTQRIPYPPNKGEKIRVFNKVKYLSKHYKIQIFSPSETINDNKNAVSINKLANIHSSVFKLPNKLNRYLISFIKSKPISALFFYSPLIQNQIDTWLSTGPPKTLYLTSSSLFEYILHSNVFENLTYSPKLIVDFMDLDSDKWKQYRDKSSGIKKWIYNREYKLLKEYEKLVQKKADYCLFTTDKEIELFKKNINTGVNTDNLITIGNGLDNKYFQPVATQFSKHLPVFIFTGVMDYKPNVDAVIWFSKSIWPMVINKCPKARFIIAGMKPTKTVRSLAQIEGVEVTGFVDDIRDYYKQANFFVAPLRIARGVQNKVLEAFACKLPVITTPNAIQGIDCEPEEHVLKATTANEFITQIERLIASADLRDKISNNALELVRTKYSWEGQLQKLDKLIKGDLT